MTWLPGWYYRRRITISASQVDSNLVNFPLCVPLCRLDTDNHHGVPTGVDLRFTDSDGTTLLPHEWTGWSDDGRSGAFVKVPSIDATDGATIYAYYGSATATDATNKASVWADYAAAVHLDSGYTSGQVESANGLAMTSAGSPTALANGVQLNASDAIQVGSADELWALLRGQTAFSVSMNLRNIGSNVAGPANDCYQDSYGAAIYCVFYLLTDGNLDWIFYPSTSDHGLAIARAAHGLTEGDDAFLTGTIEYTGTQVTACSYLNGASLATGTKSSSIATLPLPTVSNPFSIGHASWSRTLIGTYSEFRVRKGAVSAAWVKFEHANLTDSDNQFTLAVEESLPVVAGPYQVAMADSFQTDAQQSETYIPGIIAGHTHGT